VNLQNIFYSPQVTVHPAYHFFSFIVSLSSCPLFANRTVSTPTTICLAKSILRPSSLWVHFVEFLVISVNAAEMQNVALYSWLQAAVVLLFRSSALGDDVNGATGAVNSTTPSTVENEITVHTITVGEEQHFFTPNSINALPGDIVTFRFWPGNHSVVRAEFGYPCVPYEELRDSDQAGFYSGVQSPDATDVVRDTVGANTCSIRNLI